MTVNAVELGPKFDPKMVTAPILPSCVLKPVVGRTVSPSSAETVGGAYDSVAPLNVFVWPPMDTVSR